MVLNYSKYLLVLEKNNLVKDSITKSGIDINLKNDTNNDAMFFAERDKKEMYIKTLNIMKNEK